ncbi:MAG: polyamine aminopropyltransferase [Deltaproteobacteria bacterium]|nr:polyamine aminopropyltransferase [Nannocystaceae bacterium]
MDEAEPETPHAPRRDRLLLASVFAVATAGLVYELVSATMASYLLGDSVTQWSLVIGVYLTAMGLGSYLSKGIERDLHGRFVAIQLGVALVGGSSAALLFLGFAQLATVRPLLFGILGLVGTMVGLEIPLLLRILSEDSGGRSPALKDVVARVLAFDYVGSLAASLLFPLLLLPRLGLVRTSLMFGLLNAAVALWFLRSFAEQVGALARRRAMAWATASVLAVAFWFAPQIEHFGEAELYEAPVVLSQRTPYQRLTLTRWRDDLRLYIDGNLQFSSVDEHRYHEALVHPVLALAPLRSEGLRVLVLGGGDGLALREILGDPRVASIDLVDLDPGMTALFSTHPVLVELNRGSLVDPRVRLHNADAMEWLVELGAAEAGFDVAIVDLPDPNNFSLGKLYTRAFYRLLTTRLADDAVMVVQSTSPYLAPQAYWCIVRTLAASGLNVLPYHVHVPSFGDWGYVLASPRAIDPPQRLAPGIPHRFITDELLPALFVFPADQRPPDVGINQLNDQLLVHYYEADLAAGRRG